jgi:hypothetical protein
MSRREGRSEGPFRPDQVRSGDPYELSNGHPIYCAPTGQDGAGPNGLGFAVLDSDPAVQSAGVDAGLALSGNTLRAPDVAVGLERGDGTWAKRAALAVEYAGRGQDESALRVKIRELLDAGTRWVWVVRLVGPARVEVHERDKAMRVVNHDEELSAAGVLQHPVTERAFSIASPSQRSRVRFVRARRGYVGALRRRPAARRRADGLLWPPSPARQTVPTSEQCPRRKPHGLRSPTLSAISMACHAKCLSRRGTPASARSGTPGRAHPNGSSTSPASSRRRAHPFG